MGTLKDILSIIGLILGFIGIPSLSGIIVWIVKEKKKTAAKQNAESLGLQALLRSQMINYYNTWYVNEGYAPIWVQDSFENVWVQYEALGANGVMDKIHREFMSLPTDRPHK